MGFTGWLRQVWPSRSEREDAVAAVEAAVNALPPAEAERIAVEELSRAGERNTFAEPIDPAALAALPPLARSILSRFPRIQIGGVDVGGELVSEVEAPDGTVLIGRDLEHAVVVVSRDDETLWVLEPDELTAHEWPPPYPSLPHYLVGAFRFSRPGWANAEPTQ